MAVVKIIDQQKKEVGDITLPEDIFEVEVRPEILNFVVRSQLAAKRAGSASVKNRASITGGGKKPWRQKGTGRARAGSVRSPLWRGGAVAHGPQPRQYSIKVNKKVRKLALKMALSSRLAEENLLVVNRFQLPEIKTKAFCEIRDRLGLKKVLIVVSEQDNNLELSSRNIPGVKVMHQDSLNVYDVLRYPQLVLAPEVVENLQERLK